MLEKVGPNSIKKICAYVGYVSAQLLLLAAIMLTRTPMPPHVVFTVLAGGLYFATALIEVSPSPVSQAPIKPLSNQKSFRL